MPSEANKNIPISKLAGNRLEEDIPIDDSGFHRLEDTPIQEEDKADAAPTEVKESPL